MSWARDNGMTRTPNEISVALSRYEMNEVHALNEIEYQEMIDDIRKEKDGQKRIKAIQNAHRNRLERHKQWFESMEMTLEDKEEQSQKKKQAEMNISRKDNPYANNK